MRLSLRTTAVAVIAILVAVPVLLAEEQGKLPVDTSHIETGGELHHSSYHHQAAIKNSSDKSLGDIAREQSPVKDEALAYGFAAKSDEAKFFIIGSLYSEVLAYLHSGDDEAAVERLKAMETEFIRLGVDQSLYNYVTKMRSMISSGEYESAHTAELMSLFQPFFEDYAKGESADKLTLFRAGLWLLDMSLTASAGDLEMLHQASILDHFISEMKRMDAPMGVIRSLDEISEIVHQDSVSDRDVRTILKLVSRVQTILG